LDLHVFLTVAKNHENDSFKMENNMKYDQNNIFAKIIRGEIPANKVYEDDSVVAFHDVQPAAPTHILVIPKGEYISFDDFIHKASKQEIAEFFLVVRTIARDFGVKESGYRLITNHGADAEQSVPHFHVHLLGGKKLGPLLSE
jgi:diadenosine tetraphosphate (Ap4A) HIT family hydrolase